MRTAIPVSLALLVLLAGCASPSATDAGSQAEPALPAVPLTEDGASDSGEVPAEESAASVEEQSLIVTAWVSLVDDDPIAAADAIAELASAHGGLVAERTDRAGSSDQDAWASIAVRVPADELDAVLDELDAIGEVRSTDIAQVDVTQQVQDLDVRIESLQASIDRLQALLAEAADTATLLDVEEQLTQRTSELESLLAEQASLEDQVALSTLTVDITVPTASPEAPATFVDGLGAGWGALVAFAGGLAVALGAALPWLAILALLALLILALVRGIVGRRRARRDAGAGPALVGAAGDEQREA